jgi:hypothetical protein
MKKAIIILTILSISCNENQNWKQSQFSIDNPPYSVEVFAEGIISTGMQERDLAISPDKQEIIYTLGNYDQTRRILVSIKKEGGVWQKTEMLPFSSGNNDIEPFFAVDGESLFFASDRPIYGDSTRTDYNIWITKKESDIWQEPQPLDSLINTKGNEYFPSVSKYGNLFFTAVKDEGYGLEDIYRSEFLDGEFNQPKVLDSTINTKSYEFNAYISPDEDLLIFSSYGRKDGLGGGDLYYSRKDSFGNWMSSKSLGFKVNSEKLDYNPFIDFENEVFYFSSSRPINIHKKVSSVEEFQAFSKRTENGSGNIYRISLNALNLE